tara:strand:- start:100 stop:534 length:435 start_codon:yes stop_codon:yes gene_type:complete
MNNDIENILKKMKKYCAYEEKCIYDVMKKLYTFSISQNKKEKIINILKNENYINEKRYSTAYCRGKFKINNWGKLKIQSKLKTKNISANNINVGLSEIDDFEYLKKIELLIEKKKSLDNDTNKIVNYLTSKGYEYDMIWKRLKK